MMTGTSMANEIFLDAAYAIALSSPKDDYHERALLLAEEIESRRSRLVTSYGVVLEIGNALAKQRYRRSCADLLESLLSDPEVEIVPFSEELLSKAFAFFQSRMDKDWGLTDCMAFVVMKERGITDALTTDEHFVQAGFHALLLGSK